MSRYNFKVRKNEIAKMPTLTEVLETEKAWVNAHLPIDRGTKLNQYMFRAGLAEQNSVFMPFTKIEMPNPDNLPVVREKPVDLVLTPYALNQLLARLDIDKRTYYRYPATIQNMMANWSIQNDTKVDRSVLLRIIDNTMVRSLHGSGYTAIDNVELIENLIPFCPEGSRVTCAQNDDMTTHLSVVFPNTATEVKVGQVMESGIYVRNSEVGLSSVTIASYQFIGLCANGSVGGGDDGGFFRFRHTGNPERLRDAIKSSIESTYLESTRIIAQIKQAVNIAIDKPAEAMEKLCKDNQLTQEDYKAMMDNFFQDPDPTVYGLFNAVTATARDRDGEDSYQLARIATRALSEGVASTK